MRQFYEFFSTVPEEEREESADGGRIGYAEVQNHLQKKQ